MPSKYNIETSRLYISPMSAKYINDVFREITLDITKFMSIPVTGNIHDQEVWFESIVPGIKDGTDFTIVSVDKKTGDFIGGGGLHHIDTNTPSIGVWIKKSAQGNGYGLEVVQALRNWADKNIKYDYILYPVAVRNIPSIKIIESLGGKIFRKFYSHNGAGKKLLLAEYRIYIK